MRKFWGLLIMVAFLLLGCASKFVRDSDKLEAPDSTAVSALEFNEGDNKGPTPSTLSVERVLNSDGTLNHVRIIADVAKGTDLCLFTPEDSPQEGRRRVIVKRGAHGIFQVPAKYIMDYDLVHGNFVLPRPSWNPFANDSWGELTRNPASGHHGVANVVNHEGEGTCLCFIDALPAGPARDRHRQHATGAPEAPSGTEHKLPATNVAPPQATADQAYSR